MELLWGLRRSGWVTLLRAPRLVLRMVRVRGLDVGPSGLPWRWRAWSAVDHHPWLAHRWSSSGNPWPTLRDAPHLSLRVLLRLRHSAVVLRIGGLARAGEVGGKVAGES